MALIIYSPGDLTVLQQRCAITMSGDKTETLSPHFKFHIDQSR